MWSHGQSEATEVLNCGGLRDRGHGSGRERHHGPVALTLKSLGIKKLIQNLGPLQCVSFPRGSPGDRRAPWDRGHRQHVRPDAAGPGMFTFTGSMGGSPVPPFPAHPSWASLPQQPGGSEASRADRRLDQHPLRQAASSLLRGRSGLASWCVRLPCPSSHPSSISNKPSPQHWARRAGKSVSGPSTGSFCNGPLVQETVPWGLGVAETGSWAGREHLHSHTQGTTSSSVHSLTQMPSTFAGTFAGNKKFMQTRQKTNYTERSPNYTFLLQWQKFTVRRDPRQIEHSPFCWTLQQHTEGIRAPILRSGCQGLRTELERVMPCLRASFFSPVKWDDRHPLWGLLSSAKHLVPGFRERSVMLDTLLAPSPPSSWYHVPLKHDSFSMKPSPVPKWEKPVLPCAFIGLYLYPSFGLWAFYIKCVVRLLTSLSHTLFSALTLTIGIDQNFLLDRCSGPATALLNFCLIASCSQKLFLFPVWVQEPHRFV